MGPTTFVSSTVEEQVMVDNGAENPIKPLGVGEVVVRVADLRRSIEFYRDVLGLQLIRVLHDAIAFMRVADGVEGTPKS